MSEDLLDFTYRIVYGDDREKNFVVSLRRKGLALVMDGETLCPEWTKLGFHQCEPCPFTPEETLHCPAAQALYEPIVVFKDCLSYDDARVYVRTEGREYARSTSLQVGLSSLFGLLMATSGCPLLEKLRPMARFHLPFSDEDETSYRAISMYLVAQYLISREGGRPDWELKGLARIYEDVTKVNKGFVERLRHMPVKDASLNAIIGLDCFAMSVNFAITQDMLDSLRDTFTTYLD